VELDEELLGGLGRGGFLAGEIGGAGIGEIVVERHGGRVQNGVGGGGGVEEEGLGLFHRGWRRRGGTSGARPFGGERHQMERERKETDQHTMVFVFVFVFVLSPEPNSRGKERVTEHTPEPTQAKAPLARSLHASNGT